MINNTSSTKKKYFYKNIVVFLFSTLLFLLNYFYLKRTNIFFKCYFNDVLAMPLLLSYSSILFYAINKEKITMNFAVILTIVVSLFWEFITPMYKKDSISDMKDIIAYFFGTFLYIISLKTYLFTSNLENIDKFVKEEEEMFWIKKHSIH